jgi:hypothetical protein
MLSKNTHNILLQSGIELSKTFKIGVSIANIEQLGASPIQAITHCEH